MLAASTFWVEPELANVPGANVGAAFGWILFAAPIPLFFVFGNSFWIIVKLAKSGWAPRLWCTGSGLVALACWVVAYLFDNAHHGM